MKTLKTTTYLTAFLAATSFAWMVYSAYAIATIHSWVATPSPSDLLDEKQKKRYQSGRRHRLAPFPALDVCPFSAQRWRYNRVIQQDLVPLLYVCHPLHLFGQLPVVFPPQLNRMSSL